MTTPHHHHTARFRHFFGRLNPSPTLTSQASSQYAGIKAALEGATELATDYRVTCFQHGSYGRDTATDNINDLDIVALCRGLEAPNPAAVPNLLAPPGRQWFRGDIFTAFETALRQTRYRTALVPSKPTSLCVKLNLGIKVEILPAIMAPGVTDPSHEPFYIWRPEQNRWVPTYARHHQQWLSAANAAPAFANRNTADGRLIPMIKVMKRLRDNIGASAVSFHIETLLTKVPAAMYRGSPPTYISNILEFLANLNANVWNSQCLTPCGDRDIFHPNEWSLGSWQAFHEHIKLWASLATFAATERDERSSVQIWQSLLGNTYFPMEVAA